MTGTSSHQRADHLYKEQLLRIHKTMDRTMAVLMAIQFVFGICLAWWVSPRAWEGDYSEIHPHLYAALFLGGSISALPIYLALVNPGRYHTRLIMVCAQMLWSALFIHLSGGRIETHFHVFGSLAIVAAYRDWTILIPATLVVLADHLLRGLFWPESVFGVTSASTWRSFEHAAWVAFEDYFLFVNIRRNQSEMRSLSEHQAQLEEINTEIEDQVRSRTAELQRQTVALRTEMQEREKLQQQLSQAQKLESIGQLAAGIAHEINTPTQFVGDNLIFLKEVVEGYDRASQELDGLLKDLERGSVAPDKLAEIKDILEEVDLAYLQEEAPQSLGQAIEGVERIGKIVRSMKEFAHPGQDDMQPADLNHAIRNTTEVARNEWKYVAELKLDLDPELPLVPCLVGEFNQVILNLIINSSHAIADNTAEGEQGEIRIATSFTDTRVTIEVTDTGGGIPPEAHDRVFDPFFTTKEVGRGSGQGLAIAYDVITNKHDGDISFTSVAGQGTTFTINLPLPEQPALAASA